MWKAIIDRQVIYLRRRLVEPGAPRDIARIIRPCVPSDYGALVAGDDHRTRIVGRYPRLMVIVATRRPAKHDPGLSAILRSIDGDIRNVDNVGILWVDGQLLEVPPAPPQRRIVGQASPTGTSVVRAKESALPRWRTGRTRSSRCRLRRGSAKRWLHLKASLWLQTVDHRVDAIRIRRRDCDAGSSDPVLRQSVGAVRAC